MDDQKAPPTAIQYLIQYQNYREVNINLNSIVVNLISSDEHENMDFLIKKALNILNETKNR